MGSSRGCTQQLLLYLLFWLLLWFMDWGEDMTPHGLDSLIKAINKEIEKKKLLLNKTFEELRYEQMREASGYIDGLEASLVIIDQIIELEGGKK